mmetsp:Transcript_26255/g.83425  ORF Transcript_26255/g.83425 Transcript_26255/m.83425 type:complete len:201 (+) Transcript_26255:812-1414(+)
MVRAGPARAPRAEPRALRVGPHPRLLAAGGRRPPSRRPTPRGLVEPTHAERPLPRRGRRAAARLPRAAPPDRPLRLLPLAERGAARLARPPRPRPCRPLPDGDTGTPRDPGAAAAEAAALPRILCRTGRPRLQLRPRRLDAARDAARRRRGLRRRVLVCPRGPPAERGLPLQLLRAVRAEKGRARALLADVRRHGARDGP